MFMIFVRSDSNKYSKYMFYEEKRTTTKKIPFLHINLLMKYSVQQQIHFNENDIWNKYCRCNKGLPYF